jgi:hypothetical protein
MIIAQDATTPCKRVFVELPGIRVVAKSSQVDGEIVG